ncbi:MAG: peptide chain release factor N(5)-glutamine methyltransferase [Alphaproteobacteria bacterium]|nr:peptide chain release factor N(5)-glutamine methyltransferase [Alphaproteobacteria bacterium]
MTLKEWHRLCSETLSPQEAKWLLAGALDRDPSFITLNPTYSPSPAEEEKIQEWLKRRAAGEPLSRLKGVREFWSLPFYLNEHTLDPRPDTEVLIEGVLKWVGGRKEAPWTITDLGTGSGCILISLLHELPNATGVGVDISEGSLSMARQNAVLNGVDSRATFCQGNWSENLEGSFDIIVSNPPYIPLAHKDTLAKNVLAYDPHQALFGGEDGLTCYRILAQEIGELLAPHGLGIFEIGMGQREDVEALFEKAGFDIMFVLSDLAGIERAIGVERR